MKIQLNFAILLALVLVGLSSCGNDLSRDKAASLIVDAREFPKAESNEISKVFVVKAWVDGFTPGICRRFPEFAKDSAKLQALQAKQLINISERSVRQNDCNHIFADISLT